MSSSERDASQPRQNRVVYLVKQFENTLIQPPMSETKRILERVRERAAELANSSMMSCNWREDSMDCEKQGEDRKDQRKDTLVIQDGAGQGEDRKSGRNKLENDASLAQTRLVPHKRKSQPTSVIPSPINHSSDMVSTQNTEPLSGDEVKWRAGSGTGELGSAQLQRLRNRWEVCLSKGTAPRANRASEQLIEKAVHMSCPLTAAPRCLSTHVSVKDKTERVSLSIKQLSQCAAVSEAEVHREQSAHLNNIQHHSTLPLSQVNGEGSSSMLHDILDTADRCSSMSKPVEGEEHLPLAHTVSKYRQQVPLYSTPVIVLGRVRPQQNVVLRGEQALHRHTTALQQAISVEEEHIVQATRALVFCRDSPQFNGSREQVDVQRALLLAEKKRSALVLELGTITAGGNEAVSLRMASVPKGTLVISNISAIITPYAFNGPSKHTLDASVLYFIVLVRHRERVLHTTMTTSDDSVERGQLEFADRVCIEGLPHDFSCCFELYSLKTSRETLCRCEKLRIKGSASKRNASRHVSNPGTTTGFQLAGSVQFGVDAVRSTSFHLSDPAPFLTGDLHMTIHCRREQSAAIAHKSFLSLYQDVQGMASWTRFWCVLDDGCLLLWRYPEEENMKSPAMKIDLRTCVDSEVKAVSLHACPHPNSISLNVALPGDDHSDSLRVLMAADSKTEKHTWLAVMNASLRSVTLWNA